MELTRPYLSKLRPGALHQLMLVRLAELSRLPVADINRLLEGGGRPVASAAGRTSRSAPGGGQRPSLLRSAIALLLQNPALSRLAVDTAEFQVLEGRPGAGAELFLDLLKLLTDRPDLKTGSIIEHYRDSEYQHSLAKLAAWEHPERSGDVEAEFRGVLEQLRREARWAQTERLMNKEQLSGLNDEEKTELKRLLKEKTGSPPA